MAFITAPLASRFTTSAPALTAVRSTRREPISGVRQRVRAPCMSVESVQVDVGSRAVDFALPADGNRTLSLAGLSDESKTLIFYFYPRDATPGCTTEATDFKFFVPTLKEVGAQVIGVSRDSVESHDEFVKALDLNFALIADDGTLTEGYGVWKQMNMFGKIFKAVERSTFVVQRGVVVKVWRGVKAKGHAEEVYKTVMAMSSSDEE